MGFELRSLEKRRGSNANCAMTLLCIINYNNIFINCGNIRGVLFFWGLPRQCLLFISDCTPSIFFVTLLFFKDLLGTHVGSHCGGRDAPQRNEKKAPISGKEAPMKGKRSSLKMRFIVLGTWFKVSVESVSTRPSRIQNDGGRSENATQVCQRGEIW